MKRLYLSVEDKKIAGICGGLGAYFDVDPTIVRLGFVFIGLATAVIPMIAAYLIGWLIIPVQPAGEQPKK